MKALLSPGIVRKLQSVANSAMPDTCSILRKSPTPDGMGGNTEIWGAAYTNVPCHVMRNTTRGTEKATEGRLENAVQYDIALPAHQDVTAVDRIVANGVTYEIQAVGPVSFEAERLVECEVLT